MITVAKIDGLIMFNQKENLNPKYTLDLGPWRFAPRLGLSIITLCLLFILVYLGLWQMARAAYKENIFSVSQQKINNPSIDLKLISEPTLDKDRFTPISIDGVFLNNYTFLLDNQMFNHKLGFRVITPVQAPYLNKWVLVDRGWVPQDKERSKLPTIDTIYGLKHITGIINTISTGILLKKDELSPNSNWPLVIQSLDFEYIAKQLNHQVFDFVQQLNANEAGAYQMPPLDFGLKSTKHVAYAVQWFFLATVLLIYYFIVSTKRRE
jgi:surfeit locus 1 family protein